MSAAASSRLRIVLLGYIVRGPLGGMSWHHLHYALGLAGLGHDVYFVEDSGDTPWCCYDPSRNVTDADPTYGLAYARHTFERLGFGARWAYYDAHRSCWLGPCADSILAVCASADLLLNVSGVNALRPWLQAIPARAFIDTDPAFTQIRHLTEPQAREAAALHTVFFTFGANAGLEGCRLPEDGFPWQPTRQPIFLDAWPATPGPAGGRFTTVMQWGSYPAREHQGVVHGMKSESFGAYLDLPGRAGPIFELAVGGSATPIDALRRHGWALRDPMEISRDPWSYQRYVRGSKGEWSVAKHGYVISRSGWFSERSAAYLASGRPVLLQETGFSRWLPAGSGVFAFASPEQALDGIEAITARYAFHCKAARVVAEEYFDSRRVLPRLIESAMTAAPSAV